MASHIGAPSNSINYHKLKSAIKTTPDNFGEDIKDLFNTYSKNVVEGIIEETRSTAIFGSELLKATLMPEESEGGSAKPRKRRLWRKYAKSWTVTEKGGEGSNFYRATVHNKKHYRLTHLLEYGHYTRNGTHTRAFRHIEPVDKWAVERLEKEIPEIIKRSGE